MYRLLVPLVLFVGCTGKAPPADDTASAESDTDTDADTDTDTDTNGGCDTAMDDTVELPASPFPLELELRGDVAETATFDHMTCSHPPNNQLQLTYSLSTNTYTWNMRVFVREPFAGCGTYTTTVQVQLLENNSGGRYFAVDSGTVDVAVTIEDFGSNGAYGSFTTGALTGDAGEVLLAPQPIPIWCDAIDD